VKGALNLSHPKVITAYADQKSAIVHFGFNFRAISGIKSIYLVSALQIGFSTLFATALYQTLIFDMGFSPLIIGIITSLQALIAIISPVIFKQLINRFNLKLIIISLSSLFLMNNIFVLLSVKSYSIIIILLLDIFFSKGFWFAISLIINQYQQKMAKNDADSVFKFYTLSWSIGAIIGFLIAIGLSSVSIGINLHLQGAFVFSIICVLISFLIKYPEDNCTINPRDSENMKVSEEVIISQNPQKFEGFSLKFLLIALISFEILSSFIDFTMPYLFESQDNSYFWVYLVLFSQQINQTIGIQKATNKTIQKKFKLFVIAMLCTGSLIIWILVSPSIEAYFITMIIYGALYGYMYAFPTQTLIQYSEKDAVADNIMKYSSFSALGAGIVPLISGYLMQDDYKLNLQIASIMALVLPGLFYVIHHKNKTDWGFSYSILIKSNPDVLPITGFDIKNHKLLLRFDQLKNNQRQFVKNPKRSLLFIPVILPDFRIRQLNSFKRNHFYHITASP
jgi:MFS family permease